MSTVVGVLVVAFDVRKEKHVLALRFDRLSEPSVHV
jgi:hypothetical protein